MSKLTRPIRKFIARIVFFIIDIINWIIHPDKNVYYKFTPAKYMNSYYSIISRKNEKSTLDAAAALDIKYEKISKKEYNNAV